MVFSFAMAFASREPRQDIYNILWAVVFGFATLNILSLATRRMLDISCLPNVFG